VAKDAVVTEELRLRKRAAERVESIDDTVRHTEVEVDDSRGATGATPGDSAPPSPERGTRRSP
jgi:stress response protein YsnF